MKRLALACALLATTFAEARADERAPRPPASWEKATPMRLARQSSACAAVRLGEWGRIRCRIPDWIIQVRLVAGEHAGVVFQEAKPGGVDVILRLAPGDRREIAVAAQVSHGGYSVEEGAKLILSELWLAGEAEPTIVIAADP